MRNGIEKWLQNIWYSDAEPPWYLRMLVPLYRAGYDFDHRRSEPGKPAASSLNTNKPDVRPSSSGARQRTPLLVVGNITVGGSGKTPLVIALYNMAQDMGVSVGVASTGYGRKSIATLKVDANSDTRDCGDEPVLIAKRTGAPVIVAKRRQDAINELRRMSLDLIISDDGLQTAGLQRDIEICVVDGKRGIGNGELLPAGPLRESAARLDSVDYVVSNGEWLSKPESCKTGVMTLEGQTLCSLDGSGQLSSAEFFSRHAQTAPANQLHLYTGIGNPERFFATVRLLQLNATGHSLDEESWHEHRFADHHAFEAADFSSAPKGATIVMTEKDAVKCRKLGLENAWYLPVEAVLDEDFVQWFCQQLKLLKQDKP